jgi:hypothetical protein
MRCSTATVSVRCYQLTVTFVCFTCSLRRAGIAFNEQGFDCVMEYLFTGAVQGVTAGRLDVDKLQAALLAAEFFHVDALAQDAQYWAALSGVEIDTTK